MNEVVSIEIVLENCEVVAVPRECIKYFCFKEFDGWAKNGKLTLQNLDKLTLTAYGSSISALDRLLRYNDITHISLQYINGAEKNIKIDWQDDNAYFVQMINPCQSTELLDNELYIVWNEK